MIELRQQTDLIPFVQLRIPQIDLLETLLFAGISAAIFVLIGIGRGLYELYRPIHNYYSKFLTSWTVWLIVISFVAYMGFGYVFVSGISRFVMLWGAISAGLLMTIVDTWLNRRNTRIERKSPYQVLIVSGGSTEVEQQAVDALGVSTIYAVTIRQVDTIKRVHHSYDIVMALGAISKRELQRLADQARLSGQQFYHIGDTLFLEDLISLPQRIGPLMALEYKPSPLDGRWRVVKRATDWFVAMIGLILLSPLLLLIALVIKLDSPGPVLYRQRRIGKNKRLFTFIKFRTMYTHLSVGEAYGGEQAKQLYEQLIESEQNVREGVLSKIQDDPRVTRVGRWLRTTSLDELPSLWLVLVGKMSLVGPRPHMPHEVDQYDPWQERLFSIKPGITGYAQLFGRDQLPFDEEAKLDLWYIQNWSLLLDVYILVSTVKVVLRGH